MQETGKSVLIRICGILPLIFFALAMFGQKPPDDDDLFLWASQPLLKFEVSVLKKGFLSTDTKRSGDTVSREYRFPFIAATKRKEADSSIRTLLRTDVKEKYRITYSTSSLTEFLELVALLKQKGFQNPSSTEPDAAGPLFYQLRDRLVETHVRTTETGKEYILVFFRKVFPVPADVNYGDDLYVFSSHEYLVHYFGEQNVRKDMYFIAGNDMVNCSILFPNTSRQVVFLWVDQVNRRGIRGILFGGQHNVAGANAASNYVGQNSWVMKSGLHAGMTLYQLYRANDADIVFHGGRSTTTGMVVADNKGKLDFNKEQVELGCVNCNDESFARAELIQAEDALLEGRILFILSIAVQPGHAETLDW